MTTPTFRAEPCPACGQLAEPEADGDLHYSVCPSCDHEFGWTFRPANTGDTCAVGIPEAVRRVASREPGGQLPLLQIGKRPA